MDPRSWDTEELHEVENYGSTRTTFQQMMRRLNFPRRQEMTLGLRDSQIMLDPSAQRLREQQRAFERVVVEQVSRFSSSSQPVRREPGSHRLLHRRNNTPNL